MFQAIKDSKDNVESVRNFFEIDGVSVELQDSSGMTVLMHACWKGYEKIVKFLTKQVREAMIRRQYLVYLFLKYSINFLFSHYIRTIPLHMQGLRSHFPIDYLLA